MDGAGFITGASAQRYGTQRKLAVADGPHVLGPLLEAQWPGVEFGDDALWTCWGGIRGPGRLQLPARRVATSPGPTSPLPQGRAWRSRQA